MVCNSQDAKSTNKIFYILLPILVIGIYGSQTSNELTGYFKPYDVKSSNDVFTISIDKSSYKPGQIIKITGKVNRYDEGTRVIIQIIEPDKLIAGNFNSFLDRYGIFVSSYTIPDASSYGKYKLNAYYDGDPHKKQISLDINISDNQNGIAYILIPEGASSDGSKLNFDPPSVNVTQGSEIVFINNDGTVHTIISGKVNDDGSLLLSNNFSGRYLSPGDSFVLTLDPGKYNYFCKIHPWLGGTIYVKPTPSSTSLIKTNKITNIKSNAHNASTIHAPTITGNKIKSSNTSKSVSANPKINFKSFPISNKILTLIWNERKDLQKLYPEVSHGNLTGMINWAKATGWNQDQRLAALIPKGHVPSYLDSVLVTIWNERKDLQKLYPEVSHGNLTGIINWAKTTGWNQDQRLSMLIPAGQTPKYNTTPYDLFSKFQFF